MKSLCEEYILARTIEEAVATLSAADSSARIISGGSDLLLEIQQGIHPPVGKLIDVTEVEEMCAMEIREGCLFIGASVTLARITHSELTRQHAQALADATVLMANPQVCNVATIGGNVAHALPAADGTISLLALDAKAEVANMAGRRKVPLQALFKGPGESTLDRDLLVGFYLPLKETGQGSGFVRRVNPQGIPLAMLNMAIWLERNVDRVIDIRIAVGPSGPIPQRILSAEKALVRKPPSPEVQACALDELLQEAHFRTSPHRATADYRRHLAGVLLQESLMKAWQRAG
jgi:xanthine dehydrogenase FAD-binding subunit